MLLLFTCFLIHPFSRHIHSNNMHSITLAALWLGAGAYAQQAGTLTPETHPPLTVSTCTAGGTCTSEQHSVVLDANWRWLHSTSGSTNCYTGNTWDATLCPDDVTCAKNCALDGAAYTSTYGITASGDSLSLQLVTGSNVGSRVYLMDASDSEYESFNLLNQEFTFDVDVSELPCGLVRTNKRYLVFELLLTSCSERCSLLRGHAG